MRINNYIQFVLSWPIIFALLSYTACQDSIQIEKKMSAGESESSITHSAKQLSTQNYHQAPVSALTIINQYYILGHSNGAISIWKIPIQAQQKVHLSFLAHEQSVRSLESKSTDRFRSLSADGSWAEWDLNGRIIKRGRIKDSSPNVMLSIVQGTEQFTFFGDARGTVTAMKAKQRIWRTAGEHGRAVFGLAMYNEQSIMSIGSDGWTRCWFISNGQNCGVFALHQGWITALRLFNHHWLTTGSDGLIKIWPKLLFHDLKPSNSLAKAKAEFKAHSSNITQVTTYRDLILSGDDSGNVTLSRWDEEYNSIRKLWQFQNQDLAPIKALAIDSAQQLILLGGGQKKQLYVYPLNKQSSSKNIPNQQYSKKATDIIRF